MQKVLVLPLSKVIESRKKRTEQKGIRSKNPSAVLNFTGLSVGTSDASNVTINKNAIKKKNQGQTYG